MLVMDTVDTKDKIKVLKTATHIEINTYTVHKVKSYNLERMYYWKQNEILVYKNLAKVILNKLNQFICDVKIIITSHHFWNVMAK